MEDYWLLYFLLKLASGTGFRTILALYFIKMEHKFYLRLIFYVRSSKPERKSILRSDFLINGSKMKRKSSLGFHLRIKKAGPVRQVLPVQI